MYCYNTTSFRQYGVFRRSYLSPLMRNEAIRLCTPQKTTTQPLLPTHKKQRTRYSIYLGCWQNVSIGSIFFTSAIFFFLVLLVSLPTTYPSSMLTIPGTVRILVGTKHHVTAKIGAYLFMPKLMPSHKSCSIYNFSQL